MQTSSGFRHSDHHELIPRALLRAMAGLVILSILMVGFAVLTDRPLSARNHTAPVVKERMILVNARPDGGTTITAMDGTVLADLPSDRGGFVSVVRSGLAFERKTFGVTDNPPVHLIRFADGRLGLRDDATGWRISLTGFGQTNLQAWADIMDRAD